MPTARGWLVLFTGLVLGGAGHLLGSTSVDQLGFAFFAIVVIACGVVRMGRHELEIERTLSPARVRAGQPVTETLAVRNRGTGSAPLVLVEEGLPAELSTKARFAILGIEPGGRRDLSFELLPARRGRYEIGPVRLAFVDPFGLARVRSTAGDKTSFLAYPAVERLTLPRDFGDRRTAALSNFRQLTGASGEDFYTLREYNEGDDLRKIHWPSTAKRGRYMIRQEETPWHTSAVVLLDDRGSAYEGHGEWSSFERAVEAAASLVDLFHRSGYSHQLVTAREAGLPGGRGSEHLHRSLDFLAVVAAKPARSRDDSLLARLAEVEAGSRAEASLVLVTGALDPRAATLLANCRRRFKQVTAVMFPTHRFGAAATKERWEGEKNVVQISQLLARSGVRAVVLSPDESLSAGWGALSSHSRKAEGWGRKPELV